MTDVAARFTHEGMTSAYKAESTAPPDNPMMALANTLARHARLSPDDIGAILELPFDRTTVSAGSYILREGSTTTQCTLLISGFAFRQKLTRNGGRQILSWHIPGEALDLQSLFLDISDYSVQTFAGADVAIIPRQALADLTRTRLTIAHAVTTSLLIDASISRAWLLNIGRRDARARVAHLLCEFGIRLTRHSGTENHGHELPMTQEQLGDALGLTSVHINRMLRVLERDGLLVRTGRSMHVPNWERLREVAGFTPNYLHLEHKPS